MSKLAFEYLEIRPCVQGDEDNIRSFINREELEAWKQETGLEPDFWTLYGVDEDGIHTAIGDFATEEAAKEIRDAILARPTRALRAIIARVNGEWDDPDLLSYGFLGDTPDDILRFAKEALNEGPDDGL